MNESEPVKLDISGVMQRLPHRYPFLLVDRVLVR
jgi:3-hydroxymyristoyl/3-hydroxydecanoyl-(acyl carrier protein) dehydratase